MRLDVLALVIASVLPTRAAAQSVVVGVSGQPTGLRFRTVRVPVFADMTGASGASLGSYTIRVSWNPQVLQFSGTDLQTPGTFGTPTVQADSAPSGVAYVAGINAAGKGGVFDLVQLLFEVDSLDTSSIGVQVLEASAAGTLTDLLPSVVAVNGTFCPGIGRWGDLDDDGASNSRDALAILSNVVGLSVNTSTFNLPLGDVDGDAKVNSRDALIVLSYAVGLPIVNQRILLVAADPGCSAGAPPSLKILPDTVDLVRHQQARLALVGIGAGGRPVALNGANWQVSDGRLGVIDNSGLITGVDTGTAAVIASVGPGVTVSVPLVVRPRRVVWHVDPHAALATVQLGTARFPFATPEFAFPVASEGDTIRVHPGVVDWLNSSDGLPVGVVLIGDTLSDGTRPLLRGTTSPLFVGVDWTGGVHGVIQDLAFQTFGEPVLIEGLSNLTVRNVLIQNSIGDGIDIESPMDTIQILASTLSGLGSISSGTGIVVDAPVHVMAIHNVTATGWSGEGISLDGVDSADVRVVDASGNSGAGLDFFGETPTGTLVISHSRFVANTNFGGITAQAVHAVLMDHNVIEGGVSAALSIQSSSSGPDVGSVLRSFGDSIRPQNSTEGAPWGHIEQDSTFIDSMVMQVKPGTLPNVNGELFGRYAQVRRSKFLNLNRTAIVFGGNQLVVDSVTFEGCDTPESCGWSLGSGIYIEDDLSFTGLGEGVSGHAKGAALITHSSFFAMDDAVESGENSSAGPLEFRHNLVDSVSNGVSADINNASITDNVFTRIAAAAISLSPALGGGIDSVSRNSVTCGLGSGSGIVIVNQPALVEDNGVRSCMRPIDVEQFGGTPFNLAINRDTVFTYDTTGSVGLNIVGPFLATVRSNRVVGGETGMSSTSSNAASTVQFDSNSVSATTAAAVSLNGTDGTFVGSWNNIANNLSDGLLVFCVSPTTVPTLTDGRFQGNQGFAVNVNECSDSVDVSQNWWGSASGPHAVSDSVNGSRVNTANFLTADPSPASVPALAPRVFGSAGLSRTRTSMTAARIPHRAAPVPTPAARAASSRAAPAAVMTERMRALLARHLAEKQHRQERLQQARARASPGRH